MHSRAGAPQQRQPRGGRPSEARSTGLPSGAYTSRSTRRAAGEAASIARQRSFTCAGAPVAAQIANGPSASGRARSSFAPGSASASRRAAHAESAPLPGGVLSRPGMPSESVTSEGAAVDERSCRSSSACLASRAARKLRLDSPYRIDDRGVPVLDEGDDVLLELERPRGPGDLVDLALQLPDVLDRGPPPQELRLEL